MADTDDKADKIFVPKDRVFERTQGCWNCIHKVSAAKFWTERRQADLAKALNIAMNSKLGEQHPKVQNIKQMVNTIDHQVAAGLLIRCGQGLVTIGRTANGEPVGDLVTANYLCDRWTGAQGASIARAGQAPDALPEELADKIGNALPDADKLAHEINEAGGVLATKPSNDN